MSVVIACWCWQLISRLGRRGAYGSDCLAETPINLTNVQECVVTGKPGEVAYACVTDQFFGTPGAWRYRRDRSTGHLWLDPRPADDEIPRLYARYYTHGDESRVAPVLARAMALVLHRKLGYALDMPVGLIDKMLAALPPISAAAMLQVAKMPASPPGSLLDYGCGNGRFMSRFAKAGWQVCGIEPDNEAADALRLRSGYDVRSTLDKASDWKHRFDLISLNHVIEHLPDPIATLRRLVEHLKADGRIVIVTPNAGSLAARFFGNNWRGLEPPRHFNIFTPASLQIAVEAAGLRISALSTEARLARSMFLFSYLARKGHNEIELSPTRVARAATISAYLFQAFEQGLTALLPNLGEEIYCQATSNTD